MRRDQVIGVVLFCLCAAAWAVEPPPEVVALVGDEKITREALAEELAQVAGRDVLDNLLQEKLVAQEVERRKIVVPEDDVKARMEAMNFTVRRQTAGKEDLIGMLQKKGASLESQRDGVRLLLAMERMAKADFGMHPLEPISNLKMAKWLRALYDNAKIVGRGGKLPKGIYASVNGEFIPEEQFKEVLFLNSTPADVGEALERIIARILVDQELQRRGEEVTRSDIDSELARMEEVIQQNPANRHLTLDDVLRLEGASSHELRSDPNFRMRVALRKMIRKEIAPAEAEKFCEDFKALYGDGKVRARQIFISFLDPKTRQPRNETAAADAFRKIAELQAKIKEGADFAKLAKENSDDLDTRSKGGDLGFFPRYGVVNDPMAKAAFLLRKGEVSGVLVSRFGYHLIQTTDVEAPGAVDFEKVKDKVLDDMVDLRFAEWMGRLRGGPGVKVLYQPR